VTRLELLARPLALRLTIEGGLLALGTALDDCERDIVKRGATEVVTKNSEATPSRIGCDTDRARVGDTGIASLTSGVLIPSSRWS
jgi:hypothetical protein